MIYQRVLVPVSGKNSGERAAKALRHAKTLCSGEIILLHVTEALPKTLQYRQSRDPAVSAGRRAEEGRRGLPLPRA